MARGAEVRRKHTERRENCLHGTQAGGRAIFCGSGKSGI
nr:MAG TPA: hypothetical protein [Caudoviricetes sp.]